MNRPIQQMLPTSNAHFKWPLECNLPYYYSYLVSVLFSVFYFSNLAGFKRCEEAVVFSEGRACFTCLKLPCEPYDHFFFHVIITSVTGIIKSKVWAAYTKRRFQFLEFLLLEYLLTNSPEVNGGVSSVMIVLKSGVKIWKWLEIIISNTLQS